MCFPLCGSGQWPNLWQLLSVEKAMASTCITTDLVSCAPPVTSHNWLSPPSTSSRLQLRRVFKGRAWAVLVSHSVFLGLSHAYMLLNFDFLLFICLMSIYFLKSNQNLERERTFSSSLHFTVPTPAHLQVLLLLLWNVPTGCSSYKAAIIKCYLNVNQLGVWNKLFTSRFWVGSLSSCIFALTDELP